MVWLAGDFAELYERALRSGDRPMLAGRTREDAERLYRSRERFYREADLTVDTTGLNPDQVTASVLLGLRSCARRCDD